MASLKVHIKPLFEPNLEVFTAVLCFKVLSSARRGTAARNAGVENFLCSLQGRVDEVKFRPNRAS